VEASSGHALTPKPVAVECQWRINMSLTINEPGTTARIINTDPAYPKSALIEPSTHGYLYIAAGVHPGSAPFVLPSAERSSVLVRMKELSREIERNDTVVKASVFRAIAKPPTARFSSYLKERSALMQIPDFDVFALVETTSPETARGMRESPEVEALLNALASNAEQVVCMTARNGKRIADVDATRQGLFLFNHFVADDPGVMLDLWDYLAGWYMAETGLDNSVGLVPLNGEDSDYVIVNWARWDEHPISHFWHQLSKRSFRSYVVANLEENHAASIPIYCRLA
jgi:hypothetical protein